MSKNVVIKEGGSSKQITCDKLKTNLTDGGTQHWIPASEVSLGHKDINADGTYYASAYGYYGFDYVTVRGIGVAEGTDPDGDDAQTRPDPETGELETRKVPSYIRITTPPTKLEYTDGELIDYTGIVVKAYKKTTGLFTDESYPDGIIPQSELEFPVKAADIDDAITPSGGGSGSGTYYVSAGGMTQVNTQQEQINWVELPSGVRFCGLYNGSGDMHVFAAYTEPFTYICYKKDPSDSAPVVESTWSSKGYVYNGVQYYYFSVVWSSPSPTPTIATTSWAGEDLVVKGFDICYGADAKPYDVVQTVPVQWRSPYTNKILEDTFDISVAEASGFGGATGGGGSTEGGGGAGRND